jgi:hypothetical protein
MKDVNDVIPKSVRGSEAYKYMKARKADAQRLFDEAAKSGATLEQALHFAGRQIRAALLGKRIYEAELIREEEDRFEEKLGELEETGSRQELLDRQEDDERPRSLRERLWGKQPDDGQEDR